MNNTLFTISLFILTNFLTTSRPMQKLMFLLFNLSIMIMNLSMMIKTSYFSLIFMILMASGLMILFMYMASIQNMMIMNNNYSFSFLSSSLMTIILFKNLQTQFYFTLKNSTPQDFLILNFFNFWNLNMLILMLIIYMLILMIIYMELIYNFKTPLRSKNYVN